MAGQKINQIGSPNDYTEGGHGDEWDPHMARKGQRSVNIPEKPAGGNSLPENAITGAIKVKSLAENMYAKTPEGPTGASRPWVPPGRRK